MSSLRVGTITFDYYPFDPSVRRLAEAAADAGFAVHVICLRQPHEKRFEVCNGVRIYRMPMSRGFGQPLLVTIFAWCWFTLLAGTTVTWLHLKQAYDVIHVHNMPDFLVFSTVFARLLGAKIILDVQDVSPELMAVKAQGRLRGIVTRLARWQERISTDFAHHVITVGWPFEALLLQREVPQEKITLILNSADPKFLPPLGWHTPPSASGEGKPFILMYHGTLAERVGLDTAIRALALACPVVPQIRLDIMGRGEYLPALKQLAEELGVSEKVIFTGPRPYQEVANFVLHGDVGLIPYRCNSFTDLLLPAKAYEFAWLQRPMIASNTRGIRSMFRPESIMLCDPDSPESFAEAIIDLVQHPEKRATMAANALADYQPFRWEIMAERYQQLLMALSRKHDTADEPVKAA